jgi:hypothetical protein
MCFRTFGWESSSLAADRRRPNARCPDLRLCLVGCQGCFGLWGYADDWVKGEGRMSQEQLSRFVQSARVRDIRGGRAVRPLDRWVGAVRQQQLHNLNGDALVVR